MLRYGSLVFIFLLVLGGVYEYTLRDENVFSDKKILRVAADGWMISEFKLREHIEDFQQAHPEFEIRMFQTPRDFEANLMIQVSMGDIPYDVIVNPSNTGVYRFAKRRLAIPLDPYLDSRITEDMFPDILKASRYEGKTYLMPFMGEVQVLNYRKDRLAEAGYDEPPRTWDEFEAIARDLTGDGRYGASLILGSNNFLIQNAYVPILRSVAGADGSIVDEDGHLDMKSENAATTFRMIRRWVRSGIISPASSQGPYQGADDFKSGISAMFPNWQSRGMWVIKDNPSLEGKIGWAPLPESQNVGSMFAVHGAMILRGTDMAEEAWMFIEEVILARAQPDVIKAGKMPVFRSLYQQQGAPEWMTFRIPPEEDQDEGTGDTEKRPPTYRKPEIDVPDWMIPIGQTMDRSYAVPDASRFTDVAQYLGPELQKYIASDDEDPRPFLKRAYELCRQRVFAE